MQIGKRERRDENTGVSLFKFFFFYLFEPAYAEAGIGESGRAEVVFVQITSRGVILVPNLE